MKNSMSMWRSRRGSGHPDLVAAAVSTTLVLSSAVVHAETFRVGPKEDIPSLDAVAGKLKPGDVVEVQGGATYGPVRFQRDGTPDKPITIRGIRVDGRRPVVKGGRDTIEALGHHYVFEGLEITGGSFRCFFHHAHDVTLRDMVIHDCPAHGILGADDISGSMLLERSEVYRCGDGETRHPIYMATDERTHPGSVFRMQYCYVHDGNGGNNVKSRAERNEIYFNWIEGARYHELELIGPDGGDPALKREDSEVIGNVIRKTNDAYPIRIGGDATGDTNGRYRFAYNTFILEAENRPVFRVFDGTESVEMHNNVIFARGGGPVTVFRDDRAKWTTGKAVIGGSNNWLPKDSHAVPDGWTGTIFGSDPGFEDFSAFDLRPAAGSPLRNAANTKTESPAGHPFPNPRGALGFQPPIPGNPLTAMKREDDGRPDIGAFEGGFAFPPGTEPPAVTPSPGGGSGSALDPSRPASSKACCGCDAPGRVLGTGWWWAGFAALAMARRRRVSRPVERR